MIGSNGKNRTWTQTIIIDPPLTASAKLRYRSNSKARVSVTGAGGQGTLVSARWTCQDGTKKAGFTVNCPGKGSGLATVTVADGAGNTATTKVHVPRAPQLRFKKLTAPRRASAGRTVRVSARVTNPGGATASRVKVCLSARRASASPACKTIGDLRPGRSKTVTFRLKIKSAAKGSLRIRAKATSKSAASSSRSSRIQIRRG